MQRRVKNHLPSSSDNAWQIDGRKRQPKAGKPVAARTAVLPSCREQREMPAQWDLLANRAGEIP
jgi:hypothetical protein